VSPERHWRRRCCSRAASRWWASPTIRRNLQRARCVPTPAGFAGAVYPVNPKRESVQGERAWPNLAALPEVPEHVFLLAATEHVIETVRECGRLGVKVVTVLASGFSEVGPEGVAREVAARDQPNHRRSVLGPEPGVVHPPSGLLLTATRRSASAICARKDLRRLPTSGSMIGALLSRGKARGVGFAGLVSVGGEVDLSVGEICSATLGDPAIDGYVLFLESLRQGPELQAFAREAARRGKPVIAYKLGRSEAAAAMTATHTVRWPAKTTWPTRFSGTSGGARRHSGVAPGSGAAGPAGQDRHTAFRAGRSAWSPPPAVGGDGCGPAGHSRRGGPASSEATLARLANAGLPCALRAVCWTSPWRAPATK